MVIVEWWEATEPNFDEEYRVGLPIRREVLKMQFLKFPSRMVDALATYCPGRPSQLAMKNTTKSCDR